MKLLLPGFFLSLASLTTAHAAPAANGIFTNEEEVYFAGEAGRAPPAWIGVRIDSDGAQALVWQTVDRFGAVLASDAIVVSPAQWRLGTCTLAIGKTPDNALTFVPVGSGCKDRIVPERIDASGMSLRLSDGRIIMLRRARPFVCWLTVRRNAPKADGSEDWLFQGGMVTHDQGGRLRLGGGDTGAPEAIIRIRNVVWPEPTRNRPSLVLYVFTPDDTSRAVAYGWADPDAIRIGINLRWMQGSCTLEGAE